MLEVTEASRVLTTPRPHFRSLGPRQEGRVVFYYPDQQRAQVKGTRLSPGGSAAPSCGHRGAAQRGAWAGPAARWQQGAHASRSACADPMQQSYPSRNEVYTYKIYLKNRSPHLEPSYLPFLSYSVGSLNEQKGEAQRSGKEKRDLLIHQYTTAHTETQTS